MRRAPFAVPFAMVAGASALILLGCASGGDRPPDRFAIGAERLCRASERKVARLEQRYREAGHPPGLKRQAEAMWPIAGTLHAALDELPPPAENVEGAVKFEAAVYDDETKLIRVAQLPTESEARAAAGKTEAASFGIKRLAASLGLERCARLPLAVPISSR